MIFRKIISFINKTLYLHPRNKSSKKQFDSLINNKLIKNLVVLIPWQHRGIIDYKFEKMQYKQGFQA